MTISSYLQPAMYIVGAATLFIFGYYAVRLVGSFRSGILAKGWKYVTFGATLLALAQIPFFALSIYSAQSFLGTLGMGMRFVAIIFLTLGLRAHYEVWRLDNKHLAPPRVESADEQEDRVVQA